MLLDIQTQTKYIHIITRKHFSKLMKSVKVNLSRCSYILWLIFTTNPERENESPSSALDLFLKIFFVYKNHGTKKKNQAQKVKISFNPICFSKSTRRLEPRGYEIEAPSTMKSACYKRRHMPVSPPQWQMPHPKADRRHCSVQEKHNTKPAGLGFVF